MSRTGDGVSAKAKRLGFQFVRVHFGTFDFSIDCIAGPGRNVKQFVDWKFNPVFEFNVANPPSGAHFAHGDVVPLIWIPRKPRTPKEHGTLAHEVLHAVRRMLCDWAGMELTSASQEAFCHATGHAVTKIMEGLRA